MVLNLVKKDILITKKLVLITMLVVIAIPLFVTWNAPSLSSVVPFFYMVMMAELLVLQSGSQIEAKNPKAASLLCAVPYTRGAFVKAKYVLLLLIFVYCFVIHTIVMLIVNRTSLLGLPVALIVLLLAIIIFGFYLLFEFKYGFVKARFFFVIVIFALSLGPSVLKNIFPDITIDFSVFQAIPFNAQCLILAAANIIAFIIFMFASIRIYAKKDL